MSSRVFRSEEEWKTLISLVESEHKKGIKYADACRKNNIRPDLFYRKRSELGLSPRNKPTKEPRAYKKRIQRIEIPQQAVTTSRFVMITDIESAAELMRRLS